MNSSSSSSRSSSRIRHFVTVICAKDINTSSVRQENLQYVYWRLEYILYNMRLDDRPGKKENLSKFMSIVHHYLSIICFLWLMSDESTGEDHRRSLLKAFSSLLSTVLSIVRTDLLLHFHISPH
jgi:hypothetical protein